jgi:hypothetical protein
MTNVWARINEVLFSINPSTDNFTDHGIRILVLLLLVFIVVKVLKKIMEGGAFRWVFIVTLVVGLGAYFINQSGEQEVDASRLVTRNDTVYEVNSNTPFTGVSFRYAFANGPPIERVTFREGKVRVRENLKNGLREGLFERYLENGTLTYRANYKEGKYDGLSETYRDNGTLMLRQNYKNDKLDGLVYIYSRNGMLSSLWDYKNGESEENCYRDQINALECSAAFKLNIDPALVVFSLELNETKEGGVPKEWILNDERAMERENACARNALSSSCSPLNQVAEDFRKREARRKISRCMELFIPITECL